MKSNKESKLQRAQYQLQSSLDDCGIKDPQGLRLLEVGFKEGLFLQVCRQAGIETVGLEVQPDYYKSLHRREPDFELMLYNGGVIPLPDASFDIIVSYQVLEHVGSLETTLAECVRLLKPGGVMYHVFPNYRSFYEGHYKVLWWPFLNQTTGRWYLKMLRKYTPYYETLNIVKPKTLRRMMAAHDNEVDVLSLGKAEFQKRFTPEQIAKVNQPFLRKILKGIYAIAFIKRILLAMMGACAVNNPLTLIAQKREF